MASPLRGGMVAGEASGDQLGAHLIEALKARGQPVHFAGIGGPRMLKQGFHSHHPMEKLSVRGITEALLHYREILGIRTRLAKGLFAERPVLFIRTASSAFHLCLWRQLYVAGIPTTQAVMPA